MQGSNHSSSCWNRGKSPSHARHEPPGAREGIAVGDGKAAGDAGNELPDCMVLPPSAGAMLQWAAHSPGGEM